MTPHAVLPLTAQERRAFWWFMLVALVVLGAGMGLRDPWPSDEPRFALAALQMVESGDWLFPHRGSELYSDKPPLLFWMQAAAYELVRNWRIAFLLPSLLAGLLTLGLTYDLGRRLWNPRVGLFAAAALLATFQFTYQFKRAQIDPVVVGWITLGNWGLLLHFLRGPDWRAYWLGCFAGGLGVITKGVGVIVLLMFLPYLLVRWQGWGEVTRTESSIGRWLAGALFFVAPIALWVVPMVLVAQARGAPEYAAYVQDILFRQTAGRYANAWHHHQPIWYYLPIVLFSWFPLSLLYPATFRRWWQALKLRDARIALPLGWVLVVVVFFSIPSGKRDVYVLPALPMMALISAPYLEALLRARWLRVTAFSIALGVGALLAALGLAAFAGGGLEHAVRRMLRAAGNGEWAIVAAIGLAMLLSALVFRPRRGVHAVLAGLAAMWMIWSFAAYPLMNASSSAGAVMQRAGAIIGPDAELGLIAWKEQNLLMADRAVSDFGFKVPWPEQFVTATTWQAQAPEKRWLFALADALGDCVDKTRAVHVGRANRRDWWLFRADAVRAGCVPVADDTDRDPG